MAQTTSARRGCRATCPRGPTGPTGSTGPLPGPSPSGRWPHGASAASLATHLGVSQPLWDPGRENPCPQPVPVGGGRMTESTDSVTVHQPPHCGGVCVTESTDSVELRRPRPNGPLARLHRAAPPAVPHRTGPPRRAAGRATSGRFGRHWLGPPPAGPRQAGLAGPVGPCRTVPRRPAASTLVHCRHLVYTLGFPS